MAWDHDEDGTTCAGRGLVPVCCVGVADVIDDTAVPKH